MSYLIGLTAPPEGEIRFKNYEINKLIGDVAWRTEERRLTTTSEEDDVGGNPVRLI